MVLFDLWSLCHLASGIVLGLVVAIYRLSAIAAAAAVTVALVGWELFELLGCSRGWSWGLDTWWADESWANRWLADLGLGLLGAAASYSALDMKWRRSRESYIMTHA